ncbi:MAG: class I SAM-dependent methyltransferase [Gemmatimonadota bacterium]
MVSDDRWKKAQEYEQGYWESEAQNIAEGDSRRLDFYGWRADQLVTRLNELGLDRLTGGDCSVLEIGTGPVGLVAYFPAAERVAVDPLEGYYGSDPNLTALRTEGVSYREGVGEELPVEDDSMDLVVMENCIDHTQDPDVVMNEISRVLKPGGVVYLTVNCRTPLGYGVHRVLSKLAVDAGHPHTYTSSRARAIVLEHPDFESRHLKSESYGAALVGDLRGSARDKVKAVLGVSEFVTTVIGERK